jgi:hypothetical protein
MSRPLCAALALVLASSSLTACAESVTAPQSPTLAPSAPRLDAFDPGTCNCGWNSSTGRCN